MMYIARILYPVKVLGPGNRIGIWFSGCEHKCDGCSNPELWKQKKSQNIGLNDLIKLIKSISDNNVVDGFTLTGGDPFFQSEALRELLPVLQTITDDILVYTGYDYSVINEFHHDVLKYIAVLIDGKYIEEQNHGNILKGSDNQNIVILNERYTNIYKQYLSINIKNRISDIQNFHSETGTVSVGIHLPDFPQKFNEKISKILVEKE